MDNSDSGVDSTIADLRKKHRQARSSLTADKLNTNAAALIEQMAQVDEFSACEHVASYIAIRGEMDTLPLMRQCADKKYYLPLLRGQHMHFAPWTPGTTLQKKEFGLLEPDSSETDWINPVNLDAVLVPLVVFDRACNRIGQGGGFYDRTFEFLRNRTRAIKPALIGVAHESQLEPALLAQSWDVPLDLVVTDVSVYRRTIVDDI